MNQSLHDTGKSGKLKRKPKRRRNRESWNLILLMFAFHSAQAAGGWALYQELKADISSLESGLRAEISSSEGGLQAEISGLRADVSGLTERVARVETRLDSIEGRLNMIEDRLYMDTAHAPM